MSVQRQRVLLGLAEVQVPPRLAGLAGHEAAPLELALALRRDQSPLGVVSSAAAQQVAPVRALRGAVALAAARAREP